MSAAAVSPLANRQLGILMPEDRFSGTGSSFDDISNFDYDNRYGEAVTFARHIEREFLLAFWKVHILHHAGKGQLVGQWMIRELRRHGYEISPGTLYPLLARMEVRGWLRSEQDAEGGPRARKDYALTPEGRAVLAELRAQVTELYREVVLGEDDEEDGEGSSLARSAVGKGRPGRAARKGRR